MDQKTDLHSREKRTELAGLFFSPHRHLQALVVIGSIHPEIYGTRGFLDCEKEADDLSVKNGSRTEIKIDSDIEIKSPTGKRTSLFDVVLSSLYVGNGIGIIMLLGKASVWFQLGGWYPMIFPLISAFVVGLAVNFERTGKRYITEKTGLKFEFHFDRRNRKRKEGSSEAPLPADEKEKSPERGSEN